MNIQQMPKFVYQSLKINITFIITFHTADISRANEIMNIQRMLKFVHEKKKPQNNAWCFCHS